MTHWIVLSLLAVTAVVLAFQTTLLVDRFLQRTVPAPRPDREAQKTFLSKIPRSRIHWLAAGVLGLLVAVFVDLDLGVWSLALLGASFSVAEWGPRWKEGFLRRKRLQAIEDLFPQSLGMAIQALKIGQTVPQTLLYLAQESPAPLSLEWERACSEMKLGASPEDALAQMATRLKGIEEFQRFVEAIKISRQTGANLTRLLEVLLEGMEEKSRILRRMKAMTAQARLSGLLMGSLPFFLGLVFFILDPTMMTPLFTEKLGWGILLAAVLLESIGFLWIRQLLRLEA
jgi:tight adherence protein B